MNSLVSIPEDIEAILFVCYGNICRSPMAEYLFQKLAFENKVKRVHAASAGLHAIPGNQSPPEAVEVMAELGIDMSVHRARPVLPSMDSEYGLILVMDRYNLQEFNNLFPHSAHKTGLLRSFAKRSVKRDISDPYGGSKEDYRDSRDAISTSLQGLVEKLTATGSD